MKPKQKEELKTMNVENVPTYLKKHASWCNFRYEERKGNMTKVIFDFIGEVHIPSNVKKA